MSSAKTPYSSSTIETILTPVHRFPRAVSIPGERLEDAVLREVREETGVSLNGELTLLGNHEHLDGIGRPAVSHFFRADAPEGLPDAWQHTVSGEGDDVALVFLCRFDSVPDLWPVQSIFRPSGRRS